HVVCADCAPQQTQHVVQGSAPRLRILHILRGQDFRRCRAVPSILQVNDFCHSVLGALPFSSFNYAWQRQRLQGKQVAYRRRRCALAFAVFLTRRLARDVALRKTLLLAFFSVISFRLAAAALALLRAATRRVAFSAARRAARSVLTAARLAISAG